MTGQQPMYTAYPSFEERDAAIRLEAQIEAVRWAWKLAVYYNDARAPIPTTLAVALTRLERGGSLEGE